MIKNIIKLLRQRKNKKKITRCGNDTIVSGFIEKRFLNSIIVIGNNSLVEGCLVTEDKSSNITIGNNVFIGGNSLLDCVVSIVVEDDVLISYGCIIADSDNHSLKYSIRRNDLRDWKYGKHNWSTTSSCPIKISKGAWLGANSIILKGVKVGEGAIVGAGSVVTKDVPPYTIVAGNPARIIREIPTDDQ